MYCALHYEVQYEHSGLPHLTVEDYQQAYITDELPHNANRNLVCPRQNAAKSLQYPRTDHSHWFPDDGRSDSEDQIGGLGTGVTHYERRYRSIAFVDDLSPA